MQSVQSKNISKTLAARPHYFYLLFKRYRKMYVCVFNTVYTNYAYRLKVEKMRTQLGGIDKNNCTMPELFLIGKNINHVLDTWTWRFFH